MEVASMAFPTVYASEHEVLAAGGYHPLPSGAGTMYPAIEKWTEKCSVPPTKDERDRWSLIPGAGICLAMGSPVDDDYHVIAVDIDIDGDDFDLLAAALPSSPMEKFGSKGITRLFRAPKTLKTMRFNRADDGSRLADLLSTGAQTMFPPSISPKTNRAYILTGHFVPAAELPIFNEDDLDRFKDALGAVGWNGSNLGSKAAEGPLPTDTGETLIAEDEFFRDFNRHALANLDLWVGRLGLRKTRRLRNGAWEAVNTMRASSTGRALEVRKANLKFHRTGIRDMGADIGYRPTWLVSELFGLDSYAAANWLRERIGSAPQDTGNDDFFALTEPERHLVQHEDGTLVDASTGEIVGGANDNTAPRNSDAFPHHLTRPPGALGEMVDHIVATARKPSRALALGASLVALGSLMGRRDPTPTTSETRELHRERIAQALLHSRRDPRGDIARAATSRGDSP